MDPRTPVLLKHVLPRVGGRLGWVYVRIGYGTHDLGGEGADHGVRFIGGQILHRAAGRLVMVQVVPQELVLTWVDQGGKPHEGTGVLQLAHGVRLAVLLL